MKTFLLKNVLLMSGITMANGQVNLSDMLSESSDSLQKSMTEYFSLNKGGKDEMWSFSQRARRHITSFLRNDIDCNGMRHETYTLVF